MKLHRRFSSGKIVGRRKARVATWVTADALSQFTTLSPTYFFYTYSGAEQKKTGAIHPIHCRTCRVPFYRILLVSLLPAFLFLACSSVVDITTATATTTATAAPMIYSLAAQQTARYFFPRVKVKQNEKKNLDEENDKKHKVKKQRIFFPVWLTLLMREMQSSP